MLEPQHSRQDMSPDDIVWMIKQVKRDHRFPERYKGLELRALQALLKYKRGQWDVRPAHESDASVDGGASSGYDGDSTEKKGNEDDSGHSEWYLRRRPRLHR